MTDDYLIMDLTAEQGPLRGTQVQPPSGAWAAYFGVDFDDLPELTLHSQTDPGTGTQVRQVVAHHHVWTIELSDASDGHIVVFERRSSDAYSYWIFSPTGPRTCPSGLDARSVSQSIVEKGPALAHRVATVAALSRVGVRP